MKLSPHQAFVVGIGGFCAAVLAALFGVLVVVI
jgi:hypothetical protein